VSATPSVKSVVSLDPRTPCVSPTEGAGEDRVMPKVLYVPLLDMESSAAQVLLPVADRGGLPPLPVTVAEAKALVGEEARGFFSVVELLTGRWLLLTPRMQ